MLAFIINIIKSFIFVLIGHSISNLRIRKGYKEISFICSSSSPFAILLDFYTGQEYLFNLTYEINEEIHDIKGVMKINSDKKVDVFCAQDQDIKFYIQDNELMVAGLTDELVIGNIKFYCD